MERLFGKLPEFFKDEDELRASGALPDTRKALLEGLAEKGFGGEQLAEMQKIIDAEKSDLFDVLAYVAYALAPITREERVSTRRSTIFSRYDFKVQAFLEFVLGHYVALGVEALDQDKLSKMVRAKYGTPSDAQRELGEMAVIRDTFVGFQRYLYEGKAESAS